MVCRCTRRYLKMDNRNQQKDIHMYACAFINKFEKIENIQIISVQNEGKNNNKAHHSLDSVVYLKS